MLKRLFTSASRFGKSIKKLSHLNDIRFDGKRSTSQRHVDKENKYDFDEIQSRNTNTRLYQYGNKKDSSHRRRSPFKRLQSDKEHPISRNDQPRDEKYFNSHSELRFKGKQRDRRNVPKQNSRTRPRKYSDKKPTLSKLPARFQLSKISPSKSNQTINLEWSQLFNSFGQIAGFEEGLMEGLHLRNPNEVQQLVVPAALKDKSRVMVAAETGAGKTLAYLLPLLLKLKHQELANPDDLWEIRRPGLPRSLVLVPSNELVEQVTSVAKSMAHWIKLRVGGLHRYLTHQQQDWIVGDAPCDLVISTPSTFLRLINEGRLDATQIRQLVIDEADTLLSGEFASELDEIVKKSFNIENLDTAIVASATIPASLEKGMERLFGDGKKKFQRLATTRLHRPVQARYQFVRITGPGDAKRVACAQAILANRDKRTLIFCNRVTTAIKLTEYLASHPSIEEPPSSLHGYIPEKQRASILAKFRNGTGIRYLVCTDLASRGLDTTYVEHVIMFDFPQSTLDFIHRAGRTGRTKKDKNSGGSAIVTSLVTADDAKMAEYVKAEIRRGRPLHNSADDTCV